ncbi:hypothetical protein ACX441_08475, partial [Actinotignum timonense]
MKHRIVPVFSSLLMAVGGFAPAGSYSVSTGETGSETAVTSASEWDPNRWKAKIKISPRYKTEEEKRAFRAQWWKRDAKFLELETPPDVP